METKYYEIKITWFDKSITTIFIEECWVIETISKIISPIIFEIEVNYK